jgi:hypothetical protein
MRRDAGFTVIEVVVATTLLAAGSFYAYSAFADGTESATVRHDDGPRNRPALTRICDELEATSLTARDTDGPGDAEATPVFEILDDASAPAPRARDGAIPRSKRIRFRKAVGAGTGAREWSGWLSYSVNDRHELVRTAEGGRPRVVAHDVDALDAVACADGTVRVVLVSAGRDATGTGWRRCADTATVDLTD